MRESGALAVAARARGIPIYTIRQATLPATVRALRSLLGLDPPPGLLAGSSSSTSSSAQEEGFEAESQRESSGGPGGEEEGWPSANAKPAGRDPKPLVSRATAEDEADALEEVRMLLLLEPCLGLQCGRGRIPWIPTRAFRQLCSL